MKESYLFDVSFNNVVFAGRNKSYGAYELRLLYNKHILAAAIMATTVFSAGIGWPIFNKAKTDINSPTVPYPKKGIIEIIPDVLILPPPLSKEEVVPEPPKPQPVQQTQKTVAYTNPKVVKDNQPVTGPEMPDQQELAQAIIGTTTQQGETASGQNASVIEESPSGGAGGTATEENMIHDFVAEMPYFEGGEAGLLKYIGRKIKYPREAVSEQVEGVVVVSFVVDRSGAITNATILKGLGYGTDEEALRVINSMPKWTPGKQNGKPVAVRYTLPIRFSMKR